MANDERPNVLLIFTDQQRADTIHAAGNPVIRTPNLDRLVAEGTTFTSAYTPSPVCVPARCSMIYGQYPAATGCTDNRDPMPEDRPSLMQALREAGYRTHGIGKMHFTPDALACRGFQTRERQEEILDAVEEDDYLQFLQRNGFEHVYDPMGPRGEMYYVPQPAQMPARLHATNWVGDRAVAFLQDTTRAEPFFLLASFIHPHPPFSPPTPWNKLYRAMLMPPPNVPPQPEALQTYINRRQNRSKYRDNGIDLNLLRCMKAYYYACISFIDFQIGRMLQALEERGQLERTLILFTSDHGEFLGDYNCFGKRSMLDVSARVPLVVRCPERFAGSAVCDAPASLVDVMPTILSAAGTQREDCDLDGVDLREVAAGRHDGRTVYSQFQREALGVYMALNRRWKYFYSAPDRREYLIDRVKDPGETRNRAGAALCKDDAAAMRRDLMDFFRRRSVTDHLDGDAWRLYPQPEVSLDPDTGLIIQDPGWSKPFQDIPGYTD